jgi:aspartyl-tRNA(Asn)/glutamyl-tRNA(Gln) amidotransferase subunit A
MSNLFARHQIDALVVPTTTATAPPVDDLTARYPDGSAEPVNLAYMRLTTPFNVTGQPVLSIPCGLDESGLPVGLQIAGRPYRERELLSIGKTIEAALNDKFGSGWTVPPIVRRFSA